ncbi:MAG: cytochrome c biogenesis protein CcdA [Thermodesulfobacteriota bacterium]|nr:cytochrome c biogenesis protein CcdA [Thermodesulfobacteriota bacterium]
MENLISNFEYYLKVSPFLALILSYVAGVMTSFTPCVYPVIPITIGFIGARGSATRLRGFLLSIFYVLGLAVIYALIGAFTALTGSLFGEISTNPIAYFIVANICIFFGLSMFDVVVIQAPAFLRNRQPSSGNSKGIVSAFIMGAASGFVVAPCTAPVLGVLLAFVASKQNVVWGVTFLFSFAMGMGFLLILMGTFAGIISSLPKSGQWMVRVKKGLGILMIGAGEYFLFKMGQLVL